MVTHMLKKINYVFDKSQKIKLIILLVMIIIGSFVELLGVSAILPIVNIALDPTVIENTWYLCLINEMMNFHDASQMLVFLAVVLIAIYIIKNAYITLMYNFQYKFVFNNQKRLSIKLMDCYMHQNYLFHVSKNVAELQRNIANDVSSFFSVVSNTLQLISEISVCTVLIIYLVKTDWTSTVFIAVLIMIFVAFFALFYKKVLGKKGEENRELSAQITKCVLEAFSGIKEIKVVGKEQYFIDNYEKYYKRLTTIRVQQSILTFIPRPLMETLCICGLLLAMIFKIQIDESEITAFIPTLSIFAVAAFRMLPSFNRITGCLGNVMFSKPSIDAIYKDLHEVEELMAKKELEEKNKEKIIIQNGITVENLSFKYPEADKWVLENVNLKIPNNISIALIGSSGSGKTTLADIILGILEPQSGKIKIDNKDIRDNSRAWHDCIGYIPQTIYLMDDTIRANIALGIPEEEIDEEALWDAIKEAQLFNFVNELSDGLNTMVGDRGVKLSGGQRQRIGIARALYRRPQVLVLDEATSALDNQTEREVMEAIDGLHGHRTLIIIAHRLTTIKKCDMIYEVKDGNIELKDKQEIFGHN